jgi:hypothetical protein
VPGRRNATKRPPLKDERGIGVTPMPRIEEVDSTSSQKAAVELQVIYGPSG